MRPDLSDQPQGGTIQGLQAYTSVLEVPGEIDAAAVVVPAKLVPQVATECGQKGVKGLIVIASGFSEVGLATWRTRL